ncbi:unnamed protein product [Trichogramma brassicae]|uniref:Uncharacterized protein n=1 Tax=Trichogramma brassicae TaxID=86971 RepID=A0A6H5IR78_9HYME|nr:unnamed protein product [Trichogramma brassicae]
MNSGKPEKLGKGPRPTRARRVGVLNVQSDSNSTVSNTCSHNRRPGDTSCTPSINDMDSVPPMIIKIKFKMIMFVLDRTNLIQDGCEVQGLVLTTDHISQDTSVIKDLVLVEEKNINMSKRKAESEASVSEKNENKKAKKIILSTNEHINSFRVGDKSTNIINEFVRKLLIILIKISKFIFRNFLILLLILLLLFSDKTVSTLIVSPVFARIIIIALFLLLRYCLSAYYDNSRRQRNNKSAGISVRYLRESGRNAASSSNSLIKNPTKVNDKCYIYGRRWKVIDNDFGLDDNGLPIVKHFIKLEKKQTSNSLVEFKSIKTKMLVIDTSDDVQKMLGIGENPVNAISINNGNDPARTSDVKNDDATSRQINPYSCRIRGDTSWIHSSRHKSDIFGFYLEDVRKKNTVEIFYELSHVGSYINAKINDLKPKNESTPKNKSTKGKKKPAAPLKSKNAKKPEESVDNDKDPEHSIESETDNTDASESSGDESDDEINKESDAEDAESTDTDSSSDAESSNNNSEEDDSHKFLKPNEDLQSISTFFYEDREAMSNLFCEIASLYINQTYILNNKVERRISKRQ